MTSMLKMTESRRWLVVLGAVLGLAVGSGAIKVFAFSALLKPTSDAIGLPRSSIGLAFLIGNIVGMVVTPVYGRLIDRYGIRPISIPLVILWAATMASFALLGPSDSILIFPLYIASGIFSVAQTPIAYSKAITSWFDGNRGLALGIGVSGVGLGGLLMPQYVQFVASQYGWRAAYVALGVAIAAVAVPVFWLLVQSKTDDGKTDVATSARRGAAPDRSIMLAALLRRRHFWTLAVMFFLSIAAVNGVIGHLMAMLTDRGIDGTTAATALSLTGITVTIGRIAGGYLLDKLYAPLVAALFLVVPALACLLLSIDAGGIGMMAAAIGLGLGVGAEVDVLGYLVSRYFKLSYYGTVYGILFSLVTLGTASGPFFVGSLAETLHGYGIALIVAMVSLLVSALLALTLGPYPRSEPEPPFALGRQPH